MRATCRGVCVSWCARIPVQAQAAYVRQSCCCAVDRAIMQRGAGDVEQGGTEQPPCLVIDRGMDGEGGSCFDEAADERAR